MTVTVEEAVKLLQGGADDWALADAVIRAVYPGWTIVPNFGILRGAMANVFKGLRLATEKRTRDRCALTAAQAEDVHFEMDGHILRRAASPEEIADAIMALPLEEPTK